MEKEKKNKQLIAYIREGKEFTVKQKILLVLYLSVPTILAQISSIIMQYIDAAMVGHLGTVESSAIGLIATSTWLFGSLCTAGVAGFSIQLAQYIGAKNDRKAREILWQSYFVCLFIATVLALIAVVLCPFLPGWLGGGAETCKLARNYFFVYGCSLPFVALNSLTSSMLQCSGNMLAPGLLECVMCFLDVVLNMLLIFPSAHYVVGNMKIYLPGADLGVVGASLGTALSEIIIVGVMLYILALRTPMLRLKKSDAYRMKKEDLVRAAKISLPLAFERFIVCAAQIATTVIVAPLGNVALVANSFAITAESFCYMPGYGIGSAATTLVGQSVGAKREKLALSFGKITIGLGMGIMFFTGVLMYVFAPEMMGILSPDPEVQEIGVIILRIEAFAEPLYGASIVVAGVLRGAGDTLVPSILSLVSLWMVRLPLSYTLAKEYGLSGVWIAMCVELCFRGGIFLIRFVRKKWLRIVQE
ncbi:MAG: MATE family efflux transporter [Lachnospiraceae bacterium]|nr:MATE family efflux transporter [Lachnospiraceae bacterium]